jgi:hypothetical protein
MEPSAHLFRRLFYFIIIIFLIKQQLLLALAEIKIDLIIP